MSLWAALITLVLSVGTTPTTSAPATPTTTPTPTLPVAAEPAPLTLPESLPPDNDFISDKNLSDCYSLLPKPNCGSESRGGWGQLAVFSSVALALAFITWRIVRSARTTRPPGPR